MSRVSSLLVLVALALSLVIPAMAEKSRPPVYPGSQFVGFGEKKEQTIRIKVMGDVEHAGEYFLPSEATLLDLLLRLGACSGRAEFSPPHDVIVTVLDSQGKPKRDKHRFFKVAPEDLRKIPLVADALYYFAERIL